jgi:outer membrane usher protein
MHGLRLLLALATSAGLSMPAARAQAPAGEALELKPAHELAMGTPQPAAPKLIPLEVTINGARAGNWALLENEGVLYATADAFEEWRLNRDPRVQPFTYRGQPWYPLSSLPGFSARFNPAEQSLQLTFAGGAFATTHVGQAQERLTVTTPLTSAFFNYDVTYQRSDQRGIAATNDLGALTELGLSGRYGVLTNTAVGRNLSDEPNAPYSASWRRLETTFTRDYPELNASFRLGDSSTRTGAWGRTVYFGGVQWGTNFALNPGYITQPIPTIGGQSMAPSTVELYINDALRQTSQVPTGPFTIDNLPQITGSGQARIVVRDILGRETVIVQDFFSHSALLRQGLADYSVEAGAVRRNLGIDSANYGERFASGLLRYGVSNDVTIESRAEYGENTHGGGLGASVALPAQLLGTVAAAGSRDDSFGTGAQWLAELEHWSLRHGFTVRTERATRGYRQIGQDPEQLAYRRQWLASYTYAMPDFGHLGLGYAKIDTWDSGTLLSYNANYSIRIHGNASLTFSATHVGGDTHANSFGLSLVIPLDGRTTASASMTSRGNQMDGYAAVSKGLGIESGTGWRALTGHRAGQNYGEGGFYYQGDRGLLTADASASDQQQTMRLGAQGGVVFVDGEVFASRKVQDSFALVEVPGYPDVGVGFQSSVLTRTNAEGKALVPRLQPYRSNSIRLDPSELPISAELDTIEMSVVPPNRSAVKVAFPVRSGRGALMRIVLDDGGPAPAGAELALAGDDKPFFVARRGEAFVTGLKEKNRLTLTWQGRRCDFDVELPADNRDEIPRIGPFVCPGVDR